MSNPKQKKLMEEIKQEMQVTERPMIFYPRGRNDKWFHLDPQGNTLVSDTKEGIKAKCIEAYGIDESKTNVICIFSRPTV
nr:hypothetical protein 9 [Desulfobulbaceae bacterium]